MNRSILKQQLTNGHVYRLNKKIKSVSCNYHIYKIESYPIPLLQNGFEDMFCKCPQKISTSSLVHQSTNNSKCLQSTFKISSISFPSITF